MSFNLLYETCAKFELLDPEKIGFVDFVEKLPTPLQINIEFRSPTRIRYTERFTLTRFSNVELSAFGDVLGITFTKGPHQLELPMEKPKAKPYFKLAVQEDLGEEETLPRRTVEVEEIEDPDEFTDYTDIIDITVSLNHCAEELARERALFEIENIEDNSMSKEDRMDMLFEKYSYFFGDLLSLEAERMEELEEKIEEARTRNEELLYEEEEFLRDDAFTRTQRNQQMMDVVRDVFY